MVEKNDDADAAGVMDPVDFASVDVPAIIRDTQGQPSVNRAKYDVKWQWVPSTPGGTNTPGAATLGAALGAAGRLTSFVQRPGLQGGDVEFCGHVAKSTSDRRFSVMMSYATPQNIELCNSPIANNLIFGKSTLGALYPVSLYVPNTGSILYVLNNLTALENAVEIVPYGRRFLGLEAEQVVEARRAKFLGSRIYPFWVTHDIGDQTHAGGPEIVVQSGATFSIAMSIPSIGDFLSITPLDDSTREGGGTPSFTAEIVDSVSGYSLTGGRQIDWPNFIAARSLAGSGDPLVPPAFEGPFSGLFTQLFARGGAIVINGTNTDSVAITLRLGFRGFLICYPAAKGYDTNNSKAIRDELLRRALPIPLRNVVRGG